MECRVCKTPSGRYLKNTRFFYKCPECSLIFTEKLEDGEAEERHYRSQWNNSDDIFWKDQVDVLLACAKKYLEPEKILDFGAGKGGITNELQKRGYDVTEIDPLTNGYLKDQNYPFKFNLILAVEVVEHLPDLWEELDEIDRILAPGGVIIFATLLTNAFIEKTNSCAYFQNWWYKDDITHVSFFCNRSLVKVADLGNYTIDIYGDNLFVLGKEINK